MARHPERTAGIDRPLALVIAKPFTAAEEAEEPAPFLGNGVRYRDSRAGRLRLQCGQHFLYFFPSDGAEYAYTRGTLKRLATTFTVRDIMIPRNALICGHDEADAIIVSREHPDYDVIPIMTGGELTNLLPKLTETEQDLLSHIQDGYQLETDSLGGNPRQSRNTPPVGQSQYHQGDGTARTHQPRQRSRSAHYPVASEKENKLGPVFRTWF
jgi:hypothetical protein